MICRQSQTKKGIWPLGCRGNKSDHVMAESIPRTLLELLMPCDPATLEVAGLKAY